MKNLVLEAVQKPQSSQQLLATLQQKNIAVEPEAQTFFSSAFMGKTVASKMRPTIRVVRDFGLSRAIYAQIVYNRAERQGLIIGSMNAVIECLLVDLSLFKPGHVYLLPLKTPLRIRDREFILRIHVLGTLQHRRFRVSRALGGSTIHLGPSTELVLFEGG
jgi:hypothetical protein